MFDRKITLGNVLTLAAMLVSVVGAYFAQSVQIESLRGEIQVIETRVNFLESELQRRLQRIEDKLDTLTSR